MSGTFRLGVFVLAALLMFAAGVFWIASKQYLFTPTYRLNADFANVGGLIDGAEVRVGGVHQGTVKRIDLPHRPDEKMRIEMNLRGDTRDVIKKDSMAAIRAEGLVGDKYVEISFGSKDAPKVKDGDTIQAEPPLEMSDLIKKANGLLDSASGAMQNLQGATANFKDISAKVNRGTGTAGALINDKTLYRNVNAGANAFQEDMEALKHNFLTRGFFKKRGYEDSADLTKNAIAQLPSKSAVKTFTYDGSKLFDKPETAKLKNSKALNDAGKYLQSDPFGLAVVAAVTDKGDSTEERTLTEARAMVVREYLVNNFKLDDTRIKTIGMGKSADANGSKVEILVYPPGTGAPVQERSRSK